MEAGLQEAVAIEIASLQRRQMAVWMVAQTVLGNLIAVLADERFDRADLLGEIEKSARLAIDALDDDGCTDAANDAKGFVEGVLDFARISMERQKRPMH